MMPGIIGCGCFSPANDGDPYFANTVLLMGFNGTDGATTANDESFASRGAATAFVNGAALTTAQSKFGVSSLLLDGTNDRVDWADSNDWTFPGQFTIEAWVRFNAKTGFHTIISQWDQNVADRAWLLDYDTAGSALRFVISTNGSNVFITSGSWSPSTGVWYHVAADRDGSDKVRVYVDGVMKGSSTVSGSTSNEPEGVRIGSIFAAGSVDTQFFNGWIDELRITKGVARYASDSGYTVPTAAFPRA